MTNTNDFPSFSTNPGGTQLDDDPINEIALHEGDKLSLISQIDTTSLTAPLTFLEFEVNIDTKELELQEVNVIDDKVFDITLFDPVVDPITGLSTQKVTFTAIDHGQPPNTVLERDNVVLKAVGLNNDGIRDFDLVVTSAIDAHGNDVTSLFQPPFEFEVQADDFPSFSTNPGGTQLDDDPINEIALHEGDKLSLISQIDTTSLTAPLTFLEFEANIDTKELELQEVNVIDDKVFDITLFDPVVDPITGLSRQKVTFTAIDHGQPPNTVLERDNVVLKVVGLNNDGIRDFDLVVTSAIDAHGNDVTSLFQPPFEFEVQAETF